MANSSVDTRFDPLFANVAQQACGIEPLLDIFFGFLERKTDFYNGGGNSENSAKYCKELVLKYFEKHRINAQAKIEKQKQEIKKIDEKKKKTQEQKRNDEEEFRERQKELAARPKVEEIFDEEEKNNFSSSSLQKEKNVVEKKGSEKDIGKEVKLGKPIEENSSDEEEKGNEAPLGNGGKTDRYVWTQTLSSVDIMLPILPGTKSRDCIVEIGMYTLKVGLKGQPLIIDGKFNSRVKADDSMWTLVDNKMIQISIEKYDNMRWWDCVIQGDPKIDTKKIVPENSKLSDLDGDTRATVEKMLYEQRQKANGLPTSEQQKQNEILNKFKAAHPEMDFSNAKVNWGGGNNANNFQF